MGPAPVTARRAGNVSDVVRRLLIVLKMAVVVVVAGALVAAALARIGPYLGDVAAANRAEPEKVDLSVLNDFTVRSYVYGKDGSLISTYTGAENRTVIPLDQMGDTLKATILANEDEHFYEHAGVNLKATFRALLENVSSAGVNQGGSTITQQLVKNIYLTSNQTLDRKSKEIAVALRLEQQLTDTARSFGSPDPERAAKDKILETYLNTIYFGSGAYGVQAAAETYFGKDAADLDWPEAAMLAALIPSPVGNDPTLYPDRAKRQRALVIDRLEQVKLITAGQANTYKLLPTPVVKCQQRTDTDAQGCSAQAAPPAPTDYFAEEVKQTLLNDPSYGLGDTAGERYNQVFGGGLKITTTIDPGAQNALQDAVRNGIPKNDIGMTAAAVAIEPGSGAVRAMVGGPGFDQFKYNITTHPPGRQTGSSFKTFVLLTALEEGNVPGDYVDGGGSFKNPGGEPDPYKIEGKGGSLTDVTKVSSNGAFVRLGQIVGLDNVIDLAKKLGVTSELRANLSMPLGTTETTPIEMASAYSAIPNGGIRQPYHLIDRIEDRSGNVLYQHTPNGTRAFSEQTACLATQVLQANVEGGTATRARLGRQDAAGKTGTTDENADVWFVGFTPYLVTAVWMGNPDSKVPMNRLGSGAAFGGRYPAPIWREFNARYLDENKLPPKDFPKCDKTRAASKVTGPGANSKNLPPGTGSTRKPSTGSTTTTAPADGGGGGDTPAPTQPVAPPPTTSAPTTTAAPKPPKQPGNP